MPLSDGDCFRDGMAFDASSSFYSSVSIVRMQAVMNYSYYARHDLSDLLCDIMKLLIALYNRESVVERT
jgi:hypothetical protein